MDWFEKITGFTETSYGETRNRLSVEGGWLQSRVTGRRFAVGRLEVVSLQVLRERFRQSHTHLRQTIHLALGRLPLSTLKWREVVTVDRRRPSGDRAGRSLSSVMMIPRHSVLRRHVRRDHLQEVEL